MGRQSGKKRRSSTFKWLGNPATRAAATVSLVIVGGVVGVQLAKGSPDAITVSLVFICVVLVFAILAPDQTAKMVRHVTKLKVGVIEIGFEALALAAAVKPPGAEEIGVSYPREGKDLDKVVAELKDKLQFLHAITRMEIDIPDEREHRAIVYKLAGARLLTEEEAQFALALLDDCDLGLKALPKKAREEFLDDAWSFATRIRFMGWDRFARSELWKAGWVIADFPQSLGHRPDFLAHRDGEWFLMTARVGEVGTPSSYRTARDRMRKYVVPVPIAGRCVVIPHAGGTRRLATVIGKAGESFGVKVLELQGSLLDDPGRALEAHPCNQDAQAEIDCGD